tara:strand:- start:11245 stop:12033 length:789 start_codon:yes stop_codon:yes gene_type:complete
MSIDVFHKKPKNNEKLALVTCYDASFAALIEDSDIDAVLVGDSLAMVIYGKPDTTYATMNMMTAHTQAVRSRLKSKFLISDMPFLSYRKGLRQSVENAAQLIQAGANAIKLEGADGNLEIISHLVESGIPVMGHLGLTPQFIHTFGGWKVQGKQEEAKQKILNDALALEKAGCFSLVLECVPSQLATTIQKELKIPCIGIGAGSEVAGQILVLQDLLGIQTDIKPKFVKRYVEGASIVQESLASYCQEVRKKSFPSSKESYQ